MARKTLATSHFRATLLEVLADPVTHRAKAPWGDEHACDYLGWAHPPSAAQCQDWQDRASQWVGDKTETLILIGIGGSALGARLLNSFPRRTEDNRASPAWWVLDHLDVSIIASILEKADPRTTRLIIASKSGSTLEIRQLAVIFWRWMRGSLGDDAGTHCAVITDPNSSLEQWAKELSFAQIVHGKPSIGGRFSAFSAFGLFPAACMGVDLRAICQEIEQTHAQYQDAKARLRGEGEALGDELACRWWAEKQSGRPLVQWVGNEDQRLLAGWLEQLLAESTGKGEHGLLPFFSSQSSPIDDRCQVSPLPTTHLAAFMVHAFYATAIYAALCRMNPFDQPDVESTKQILRSMMNSEKAMPALASASLPLSLEALLADINTWNKTRINRASFIAILDFQSAKEHANTPWNVWKEAIAKRFALPILHLPGPGYLHSIGQLFKGASLGQEGFYAVILPRINQDIPIPDEPLGVGALSRLMALADSSVLAERGRTVRLYAN